MTTSFKIAPALADRIRAMSPAKREAVRNAIKKAGGHRNATRIGSGINMTQVDGLMVFTKGHRSAQDGQRTVFVLDVADASEDQRISA